MTVTSGVSELAREWIGRYNDHLDLLHATGHPGERHAILGAMGYWADSIAVACTGDERTKWEQQSALIKGVAGTEAGHVPDPGLTDLYPGDAGDVWMELAFTGPDRMARAGWLHQLIEAIDESRGMLPTAVMVLDDIAASEITAASLGPQS